MGYITQVFDIFTQEIENDPSTPPNSTRSFSHWKDISCWIFSPIQEEVERESQIFVTHLFFYWVRFFGSWCCEQAGLQNQRLAKPRISQLLTAELCNASFMARSFQNWASSILCFDDGTVTADTQKGLKVIAFLKLANFFPTWFLRKTVFSVLYNSGKAIFEAQASTDMDRER